MPVVRIDLLVADPEPVWAWIEQNRLPELVRAASYDTVRGHHFKLAVEEGALAREIRERWKDSMAPVRPPAKKLTAQERKEIATKAAATRWG